MNEKLLNMAKEKAFDIQVYESEYAHHETEYSFSESGIVALLELVAKLFATPNTYKGRETEALLCMTQQREDLLRDLGHARLTDVGLNALEVAEAELAEAMKILNQIADMPRKTREQRLAYSFVTFIKALQSAATL